MRLSGSASSWEGAHCWAESPSSCDVFPWILRSFTAMSIEAPTGLQARLATAQPGDVLDISGVTPLQLPSLPVVRPWTGGTLVFSDSPEIASSPGILYADTLAAGFVRLMLYHESTSPSDLNLSVVVEPVDASDPPVVTQTADPARAIEGLSGSGSCGGSRLCQPAGRSQYANNSGGHAAGSTSGSGAGIPIRGSDDRPIRLRRRGRGSEVYGACERPGHREPGRF